MQGLDLFELRAVYAALPVDFDNDRNGAKAEWRASARAKLEDMIKKDADGKLGAHDRRHYAYGIARPPNLGKCAAP